MIGVQVRDKPDARSAMENNAAVVTYLLLHTPVFFLSVGVQVLNKPDVWTLVTVRAQARDKPNM